jgi:hypothetical protein
VLAELSEESSTSRWPVFTGAASRAGMGSVTVLAVPMRPDRGSVGVFAIHGLPAAPTEELTGSARFLADAIALALVRDGDPWDAAAEDSWPARARIHRAIGMVIAQLHVSPHAAEALLRAHA